MSKLSRSTTMKEPTLQPHRSTAVHVERFLPKVVAHQHREEGKKFRIRPLKMRSCTSDSDDVRSAKIQVIKSSGKDFVVPAGNSQKGGETALESHRLPDRVYRPHELSHPRLQELVPLRPMHVDSATNTNKARGREPKVRDLSVEIKSAISFSQASTCGTKTAPDPSAKPKVRWSCSRALEASSLAR